MKESKYLLFARNTTIAYICIGFIVGTFSMFEKASLVYKFANNLIFGGTIIALIIIFVVFKPRGRDQSGVSIYMFNDRLFKKNREQEKPVEFIGLSIICACALIIATGYLIIQFS